jgi:hypothetical protein
LCSTNQTVGGYFERAYSEGIIMSFSCYICNEIVIGHVRCLFCHLRSSHFICETRGVILKCGQGHCVRCYRSFNSLAHHLRDQHSGRNAATGNEVSCVNTSNDHDVEDTGNYEEVAALHAPSDVSARPFDSNRAAANFIASLLSSSSVT